MVAYASPRTHNPDLRTLTPMQLLMLAISASAAQRRSIERELDRRSGRAGRRRRPTRNLNLAALAA